MAGSVRGSGGAPGGGPPGGGEAPEGAAWAWVAVPVVVLAASAVLAVVATSVPPSVPSSHPAATRLVAPAGALVAGPAPGGAGPVGTDSPDLGGDGTAVLLRGRPYHQDDRSLTTAGQRAFARGAEVFQHPVTVTPPDGTGRPFSPRPGTPVPPEATGPLFDLASCMACHVDGTEEQPVRAPGPGLVVKVADAPRAATGAPHPRLGVQLSTDAVAPARPEGRVEVRWESLDGVLADGTAYRLRRPLAEVRSGLLAPGDRPAVSLRVAPPLLGLGLLEAVPADDVAAAADPGDGDGDGISGRVGRGRFGWKAAQPTVRSQTVVALSHDMGVTTGESPDPCEDRPVGCTDVAGERPELFGAPFDDLLLYTEAIAVPRARGLDRPVARRGAEVFGAVGCASCHTPQLRTGTVDDGVPSLFAGQVIHPYTDLLLHDLGPGLDDGVGEPGAAPSEWRTAPLWGIGLRDAVYGGGHYLHDGRAATLEEAVLWHGGEASAARDAFARLEAADRRALLAFLRSL